MAFDVALGGRVHLVPQVGHGLLGGVDQGVGLVAGLDQLPLLVVFRGMEFGILDEVLDLLLGQAAGGGDADGLLLAGAHILGGDLDDAVGVDVEGDIDLGNAPGRRRNAEQLEPPQRLVIPGHIPFALEHVDGHRGLIVRRGGEDLVLPGGDGGVAVDDPGEDASQGLDPQGQGGDVQQEDILHLPFEDPGLNGGAHRHHFIGVHPLVGFLAEDLLDLLLDLGHAGHAPHQDDFVDVLGRDLGIL